MRKPLRNACAASHGTSGTGRAITTEQTESSGAANAAKGFDSPVVSMERRIGVLTRFEPVDGRKAVGVRLPPVPPR